MKLIEDFVIEVTYRSLSHSLRVSFHNLTLEAFLVLPETTRCYCSVDEFSSFVFTVVIFQQVGCGSEPHLIDIK